MTSCAPFAIVGAMRRFALIEFVQFLRAMDNLVGRVIALRKT
jgi:hypothetical protein